MDGLALAADSQLAYHAGPADRGGHKYEPTRLDGAEGFLAGRRSRIGTIAALRVAAQPGCGRLEAGRSTGRIYRARAPGGSVAGIDSRGRSHGRGSGDLQTTHA